MPRGSDEPKFTYAGDLESLGHGSREAAETRKADILASMVPGTWLTCTAVVDAAKKYPERTVQSVLKKLVDEGKIDRAGNGRATRYCRHKEIAQ